jgi:chemotaxis protein MotB
VDLELDPRGLVVSMREAGTFSTGRADLSADAQAVLAELARALAEVGNSVRVEGHTDDVPIHNERFASNWELSTARATGVVAYLLQQGVPPDRLSAAGYGEFHPREQNDSDANRARNRRVDVVVLNPVTQAREEPAPAPATALPTVGR